MRFCAIVLMKWMIYYPLIGLSRSPSKYLIVFQNSSHLTTNSKFLLQLFRFVDSFKYSKIQKNNLKKLWSNKIIMLNCAHGSSRANRHRWTLLEHLCQLTHWTFVRKQLIKRNQWTIFFEVQVYYLVCYLKRVGWRKNLECIFYSLLLGFMFCNFVRDESIGTSLLENYYATNHTIH